MTARRCPVDSGVVGHTTVRSVVGQEPDWISTGDAAELLGITGRRLYRLVDEGHLPAYKIGRVIRLRRDEVVAYRDRADIP